MIMPRLTPLRSGPGLLYALCGALWASVRRFGAREYRDTAGRKNRSTGLQMAFTAVLLFYACFALLDMGAKMPPAGRRMAHKRLEAAGEDRNKGGRAGQLGGHEKARPRKAQGGRCWYSRFFRRFPDDENGKGKDK